MKLKSGFLLHSMGQEHVVVPVDDRTKEFHGMIRLNESAAYLWTKMQEGDFSVEKLANALTERYEVSDEDALRTAEASVEKLLKAGIIEE